MSDSRPYLVAVVLLAVLAVAFGVFGTVAPPLAEESGFEPQQESSESVGHFQNPPTYDSGWIDITNRCGQYFNITHNLNIEEVFIDITGKQALSGGEHKRDFGTDYTPGWSKNYGGAGEDYGARAIQTSDGGYAIVGYTESYGAGMGDFLLAKTDEAGALQWNKTYGRADYDYPYSVIQTSDGGYVIAGETVRNYTNGYDYYLVKTNYAGDILWEKTYGDTGSDQPSCVIETSDGGYAIAGSTDSEGALGYDCWLVKTDSSGNKQWSNMYGGEYDQGDFSVVQTSDEGYAIAGRTYVIGSSYDAWLLKTDSIGVEQWNENYGGIGTEFSLSVVQTSDGGYTLGGRTASYGAGYNDFWLVRTDSAGTALWNKTYGGANNDYLDSMVQTSDGGYALAGSTFSYSTGAPSYADFWLVKTDSAGNHLWNETYGGARHDAAYSVVQTNDGGYTLAGETYSISAGNYEFCLVKAGVESGLDWTDSTNKTVTLYRGRTDAYWNFVRVRVWAVEEPSWIYGDINMDGVVDAKDLYIIGRNYGKTFSLLSLTGIIAVASIHTIKTRKQQEPHSKKPSQPNH